MEVCSPRSELLKRHANYRYTERVFTKTDHRTRLPAHTPCGHLRSCSLWICVEHSSSSHSAGSRTPRQSLELFNRDKSFPSCKSRLQRRFWERFWKVESESCQDGMPLHCCICSIKEILPRKAISLPMIFLNNIIIHPTVILGLQQC